MKKISNLFLTVFGVGITICLFAGAAALLGFIFSLFVGGEMATSICVFIHKQYFPVVIRFTSVFALCGLVGMYLGKMKSLTASSHSKIDKAESESQK